MNLVQPIREIEKINEMKETLFQQGGLFGMRNRLLFVMGINLGLRVGDLIKLQVHHVLNKSHIKIRADKTGKPVNQKILPNVQSEIQEYVKTFDLKPNDFLFCSRQRDEKSRRKPISRGMAWKILKDAAEACGIDDMGTHSLRKSFGYHFFMRTKDAYMLKEIFGHSDIAVTKRYIGIVQKDQDDAMEDFGGL